MKGMRKREKEWEEREERRVGRRGLRERGFEV